MSMQTQTQATGKNVVIVPVMSDMDLRLDVRTQIAHSNFGSFQERAREFLANINLNLESEDDFATADQDCETLKTVETKIRETIRNVASGNAEIEEVLALASQLAEEFRTKRLALEKLVEKERQARKKAIVDTALAQLLAQMGEYAELTPMFKISRPVSDLQRRLEDGGKNKKGLNGYQKGVQVAATRLQLDIQEEAIRLQERLAMIPKDRNYLFSDQIYLVASHSDLETIVFKRVREDDQRKALEAEEQRKQQNARQIGIAMTDKPVVQSVEVCTLDRLPPQSVHDVGANVVQTTHGVAALPAAGEDPIGAYRLNLKCTRQQAIFIGKRIKAEFPDIFQNVTAVGA